jgi:threonine/homoserine/homoserine lactone efflux protein
MNYGTLVISFVVLLLIPGPGNFALISATGQGKVKGGCSALLGVLVGDQILMWLALCGIATVLQTSPRVFLAVKCIGGLYLAYLGISLSMSRATSMSQRQFKAGRYFRETLTITLFNPKTVLFYTAYLPLFVDPLHRKHLVTFCVLAATVSTLTFLYGLIVVLLTYFCAGHVQSKRRWVDISAKIAGACLIGFGAKLVFL